MSQQYLVSVEEGGVGNFVNTIPYFNAIKDIALSFLPIATTIWDFMQPIVGFFLKVGEPLVFYGDKNMKHHKRIANYIERHAKHYDFYVTDPVKILHLLKLHKRMKRENKQVVDYSSYAKAAETSMTCSSSHTKQNNTSDVLYERHY